MTIELKMPKSGMGITEGTIVKWHKKAGDDIAQGDILVEIETAKAIEELESPVTGRIKEILIPEDEDVEVLVTLAILEET